MIIRTKDGRYWECDGTLKAWPIGGGFERTIPLADIVEWNCILPKTYKLGMVGFDDQVPIIEAYWNPLDRWNGWLKPLATRAQVQKFIEWCDSEDAPFKAKWVNDQYLMVVDRYSDNDLGDSIYFQKLKIDGKTVEVWDLSLGLVWEEITQ